MPEKTSLPDAPLATIDKMKIVFAKCKQAIAPFKLSIGSIAVLYALIGFRGVTSALLWSDLRGLRKAGRLLGELLIAHRKAAPPGRTYWHITFTDDGGMISDRWTIVDLEAVKDKATRALRNLGLSGFIATHLHPLMNYPGGGKGRSFLLGCHVIMWVDDAFDSAATETALNASRSWTNSLGGKPVKIQRIGDTEGDSRRLAGYLFNPAYSTKNRMPSKKKPGRMLLMDTVKGYRPDLALRAIEVMSQIALTDTFTGANDRGGGIAATLRTALNDWHKKRVKSSEFVLPSDFDTWRWWLELRREHGSSKFAPVRIVSGGIVPRAPKPKAKPQPKKPIESKLTPSSETPANPVPTKRVANWRNKIAKRTKAFHKRQGRRTRPASNRKKPPHVTVH